MFRRSFLRGLLVSTLALPLGCGRKASVRPPVAPDEEVGVDPGSNLRTRAVVLGRQGRVILEGKLRPGESVVILSATTQDSGLGESVLAEFRVPGALPLTLPGNFTWEGPLVLQAETEGDFEFVLVEGSFISMQVTYVVERWV